MNQLDGKYTGHSIRDLFLKTRSFTATLSYLIEIEKIESIETRKSKFLYLLKAFLHDFNHVYSLSNIVNEKTEIEASAWKTIKLFTDQNDVFSFKNAGMILEQYFSAKKFNELVAWIDSELSRLPPLPKLNAAPIADGGAKPGAEAAPDKEDTDSKETELVPGNLDEDGYFTPVAIAKRYGLATDMVRKRLDKYRKNNDLGWQENANRRPRESMFLYQWRAIKHLFE
jgi:hypothetical protein